MPEENIIEEQEEQAPKKFYLYCKVCGVHKIFIETMDEHLICVSCGFRKKKGNYNQIKLEEQENVP